MQELGTIKPGDTYNEFKYRVLSNEDGLIKIIRLSDNWRLEFFKTHPSWKHKVKITN